MLFPFLLWLLSLKKKAFDIMDSYNNKTFSNLDCKTVGFFLKIRASRIKTRERAASHLRPLSCSSLT